jgi:hypothetical protein
MSLRVVGSGGSWWMTWFTFIYEASTPDTESLSSSRQATCEQRTLILLSSCEHTHTHTHIYISHVRTLYSKYIRGPPLQYKSSVPLHLASSKSLLLFLLRLGSLPCPRCHLTYEYSLYTLSELPTPISLRSLPQKTTRKYSRAYS